MNYIGSKLKLSSWIKEEVKNIVGDLSDKIFCDLFAGTGIIGRTFKLDVKKIISNDIEQYSYVLNKNYIQNHAPLKRKNDLLEKLNALSCEENGFIYQNYCLGSGSNRQYFSDENGKKIDTIRKMIKTWKKSKEISTNEYFFLLASLLESADKVANTASVYGAYLKHLKKSAQKGFVLQSADFTLSDNVHKVYKEDSNELIKRIHGDILYLDPPYNQRQYGANYHILNTIALYDDFTPKGKTGMREYVRSSYCKKQEVKNSFEQLIKNANFKYIFLSYNNEGLMSIEDVKQIMTKYSKPNTYKLIKKDYQRFKADKTRSRNHKAKSTFEYLHVCEK